MKLTYDPRYNVAYIQFGGSKAKVNSIKVSEEVILDLCADGSIHGIELLNAKEQLQDSNSLHLRFVNEATGAEQQINMAA